MGWWKTPNGMIGDGPADIMDKAWHEIEKEYRRDASRPPTQREIADLVEFTTCGALRVVCGSIMHPFTKATAGDADTPRATPRGAKGAFGCSPPVGKMINVDPATGEHFDTVAVEENEK